MRRTHAVFSANSSHSKECVLTCTLEYSLYPGTLSLSLSFCALPVCPCCVSLWSIIVVVFMRNLPRSSLQPRSKACWDSSSRQGEALQQTMCSSLQSWCVLCLCVYCELMCTLVFLGLQTHRQPVLANGIYGKKFT